MVQETYTKSLTGQCVEAIILGLLMTLTFSIFGLPYPPLVGFITGISAFIPYIGAFVSCSIALLPCVLGTPHRLLTCLIVYVVTQFIENQFIYPRVVGTRVGLSPLYTLLAALIGGKFFGLVGILFFIPLTACLAERIQADTEAKLKQKEEEKVTAECER